MRRRWIVWGRGRGAGYYYVLDTHFFKASAIRHAKRIAKMKGFQMVQVGHSDRPDTYWGWELEA